MLCSKESDEFLASRGLGKEGGKALVQEVDVFSEMARGVGNDGRRRNFPSKDEGVDFLGRLDPVHHRHVYIHDYKLVCSTALACGSIANCINCFSSVMRLKIITQQKYHIRLKLDTLKVLLQNEHDRHFVVHN